MDLQIMFIALAITSPLGGALLIWILGKGRAVIQRRAAAASLALSGMAVLGVLILQIGSAQLIQPGSENTSRLDLNTLSVLILSLVSALVSWLRASNQGHDYQFLLLLNSAWGGAALIQNWVVSLACLSLILIVTGRWARARGSSVGYFSGRDDYKNDLGPK